MISNHTYTVTVQAVTKLDHAESDVHEHLQTYMELACTALRQQLSGDLQINTIRVD